MSNRSRNWAFSFVKIWEKLSNKINYFDFKIIFKETHFFVVGTCI